MNGGLGALFVLGDDVGHGTPQSDLNGHRIGVLHGDQPGYRPPDALERPFVCRLQRLFHRAAKAFVFLFQRLEHLAPVGYGPQLAAQVLLLLGQLLGFLLPGLAAQHEPLHHVAQVLFPLPPVMAPDGLISCPSSVTMRYR